MQIKYKMLTAAPLLGLLSLVIAGSVAGLNGACSDTDATQGTPSFITKCVAPISLNTSEKGEALDKDGACGQSNKGYDCTLDPKSKDAKYEYWTVNTNCSGPPQQTGSKTIHYKFPTVKNCAAPTPTPKPSS